MELIVSHPSGAPVVQDYLAGREPALRFYGGHFSDLDAYRAKAAEVDGRFDRAARELAAEAVTVPPGADEARLERFVEEGGYMVTTGQQPGLYGGPLYSIFKGLTAVRLAEALEAKLGKPVIPVFWVASDDHDWEEASHADLIGVDNELHHFELSAPKPDVRPPLDRIDLGADADALLDDFVSNLPDTDFSAPFIAQLREAFQSGRTIPEGFHDLMHAWLGRLGLFFTDATARGVKRGSHRLFISELERAAELEEVLRGQAQALGEAGYDLQVPILEGGVNLFLTGEVGRERLYRDGDAFRLRSSGRRMTLHDVLLRAAEHPLDLTPNVLLRPVVESVVFPTLSYVGGPGEMAYFAQLGDYFRAHGVEMPVVHPRWAAAPVETKIRKVLDKFGLEVTDLARPFHEIASDFARDEVPSDVRAAIGMLRGAIGSGAGDLQQALTAVDPTLKASAQHFRSQAFTALDDVEKRVVQAVKRESEIALGQIEKAQLHLYPSGRPAERVQSPLYYLTRYGDAFLDEAAARFEVEFA